MDKEQELSNIKEELEKQIQTAQERLKEILKEISSNESELDEVYLSLSRVQLNLDSATNSLSEWLLLEKKGALDQFRQQEDRGLGFGEIGGDEPE